MTVYYSLSSKFLRSRQNLYISNYTIETAKILFDFFTAIQNPDKLLQIGHRTLCSDKYKHFYNQNVCMVAAKKSNKPVCYHGAANKWAREAKSVNQFTPSSIIHNPYQTAFTADEFCLK